MKKSFEQFLVENAKRFMVEDDSDSSDSSDESVNEGSHYYEDELNILVNDPKFANRVKFADNNGNNTRWMDLNSESIEAIKKFLDKVDKKEVVKEEPLEAEKE